jgi:hypothetical protein
LLIRFLRRLLILALGILSVWLIVFVFRAVDQKLYWILALSVTYAIAAYLILPRAVRMGLKILQRKSVPSFTITGDGLPGDPVNLVLVGTLENLRAAFRTAGWVEADRLGLASSWRMIRAFVMNSPYLAAPFSTLYLYGRGQDIGFEGPSATAHASVITSASGRRASRRARKRSGRRPSGSTPTVRRTRRAPTGSAPGPGTPASP